MITHYLSFSSINNLYIPSKRLQNGAQAESSAKLQLEKENN